MAVTWTPKQAATGALLVLAFPNSPLVIETVKRDPAMRPLLDHLIDRRIRWHFIEISSDEVIATARAYDAAGDCHLAEMWLHGLSGETVELFEPAIPAPTLTEPDMRALLGYLTGHPWTRKYLERWDAVREELRALLDDPWIRMAAMPRPSRLATMGLPVDAEREPTPPIPDLALRSAGLDRAADAEEQTRALNRRIVAAFPALRNELRD